MSYSDFDLKKVKQKLNVHICEKELLFSAIQATDISNLLKETLAENIPLAEAMNTEKARSELIISPVLVELRKSLKHKISLFSGIEFNVDKEKGLNGFCDFIVSAAEQQLLLESPIIAIVEAKNENIIAGIGQCIAEMVAARIFNEAENNNTIQTLYGVVTTGSTWKFLKMKDLIVSVDLDNYSIEHPDKILGILLAMVAQTA
jgi:hypothetical protein